MLSILNLSLFLTLFICLSSFCHGNEIDQLKSKHDVNKFISEKMSRHWNWTLMEKTELPAGFNPYKFDAALSNDDVFYKVDLDGNGRTDLIICGVRMFAITDEGDNIYKPHFIETFCSQEMKKLVNIIYKPSGAWLVLQKTTEYKVDKAQIDTLVYKYGQLLELNRKPDNFEIEYISFAASECYGSCPDFNLQINANGYMSYNGNAYATIGFRRGYLDSAEVGNIFSAMNYINAAKLKDDYRIPITDLPSETIKIIYRNHKTKIISDYGSCAPLGLEILCEEMFAIARRNGWLQDGR